MTKKIIVFYICSLLLIFTSCKEKMQSDNCLIQNFNLKGETVKSLDQLFGKQGIYTPLETTDEPLIGRIAKIVKRKKSFFILSEEKEILQFNENGKFISSLKKSGRGPGEYTMISDFNIYINNKGEIEIWVCDYSTIKKYHYKNNSWEYSASIDYPYVINKFYIINKNSIFLLTGQNEHSLTYSDGEGNEISSYLKSEIPFLVFKAVQFEKFRDELIFQKGMSNGVVRFSLLNNTYKESKILCEESFLSPQRLLQLFSEYEYDYLRQISEYAHIRTLKQTKTLTLVEFYMNKKRQVSVHNKNVAAWKTISYNPEDILNNSDFQCLSTIGVGDGDETTNFIMFMNNENENENPIVVEY